MARKRSTFTPDFKMLVVLEAFQTQLTLQQLAGKHQISVKNIMNWKQQFLNNAHLAFQNTPTKETLETLKKENLELERKLTQATEEKSFVTKKIKELKL